MSARVKQAFSEIERALARESIGTVGNLLLELADTEAKNKILQTKVWELKSAGRINPMKVIIARSKTGTVLKVQVEDIVFDAMARDIEEGKRVRYSLTRTFDDVKRDYGLLTIEQVSPEREDITLTLVPNAVPQIPV
jgi:hypothetical protein